MTYPPSNQPTPPSGAPGPWQPYQQQGGPEGYPNTAGNPEQAYGSPYGAPQQPYGAPYGAPQQPQSPYGAPYGAPQPYGTPQQYGAPYGGQPPYGYPAPPPPGGGNRKWWAIGGAMLAVLILVGTVSIFVLKGDSGSSGDRSTAGSSQSSGAGGAEQEVRDFLDEVMSSSSDLNEALPYFCQADQELFDKIGGLDAIDIPKTTDSSGSAEITKITVNGSKAVVDISSSAGPGKLYLRKESGSWKICMSDMPGMPSMP